MNYNYDLIKDKIDIQIKENTKSDNFTKARIRIIPNYIFDTYEISINTGENTVTGRISLNRYRIIDRIPNNTLTRNEVDKFNIDINKYTEYMFDGRMLFNSDFFDIYEIEEEIILKCILIKIRKKIKLHIINKKYM